MKCIIINKLTEANEYCIDSHKEHASEASGNKERHK